MNNLKYSVLMSVYHKEKPEYLKDSIISMSNQTIPPDEIVLVKDGPLTKELDTVIEEFLSNDLLKVISLTENVGLGKALNIGLSKCRNELIARMDTDDISVNNRCEKQLEVFSKNDSLSVVGTAVAEFIGETDNIIAYKEVKTTYREILNNIKFRNPINHPSVMFKKSDVLSVGSYKHLDLNEDYYLWLRMVQQGFVLQNINEPLVMMRITDETYLRRGGWNYFITQKKLFDFMLKNGLINILEYTYNNLVRLIMRVLIPNRLRKILYLKVLRKKVTTHI
ncbi:glycosyltransferase involved in cell wall biosynthesis [Evansella vedderi]|uniref:Glycosyltransferase involved in cell wall biosynthesis n=1 Tax=Evansella vedderi TaxID=38282 RepID=A0ABT9ZT97_9BACI|nr:glycosyltransferase [Evansella vedderi]MDQ0254463.1 glycosyltransferase involved in cell wall biosynthesis [Evansella vedderi]